MSLHPAVGPCDNLADLAEDLLHARDAVVAVPQQVDVSCGSVRLVCPKDKKRSSLEHEAVTRLRPRQPVEPPLKAVADEDVLEVLRALFGQIA